MESSYQPKRDPGRHDNDSEGNVHLKNIESNSSIKTESEEHHRSGEREYIKIQWWVGRD